MNISPLIDVVFLLLIFFVVTTVFVDETGIDIARPRAVAVENLDRQAILIALSSSGQILYGAQEIPLNSVRGVVARQLRLNKRPVVILADETSRTGRLVELVDECKLAGAEQVNIAASREQ